jgi:hypothetical protein
MPSTSKKQHNFMAAVANNPAFAKKVGVPQSVGKDFSNADKGKTFKRGGDMATKMDPRVMAMMAAKKRGTMAVPTGGMMGGMKKGGMAAFEKSGKDVEKKGMKEGSKADMALDKKQMMGMKKGGMKKMAAGGFTSSADGIASKGKTKAKQIVMKKGGMAC